MFPGFSAKGMVLVNPFLRFTKTTDFLLKSPVLRARDLKRLLNHSLSEPPGIMDMDVRTKSFLSV